MTTLQIYINPKLRKESSSTDENKSKFLTDDHGERVRGFVKIILAGAINQISGTQHTSVTKKKTSRKNKKKRKDFFQIFVKMKMRRATFEAEMQNGCEVESTSGERKEETVIRINHHLLRHYHHNCQSSVMTDYVPVYHHHHHHHHHHHRRCHPDDDEEGDQNVKWEEAGIKRQDKNLNSGNCLG